MSEWAVSIHRSSVQEGACLSAPIVRDLLLGALSRGKEPGLPEQVRINCLLFLKN